MSPVEIEKAIEVYSETAARCGLPLPRAITPQRRKKIAGVLRAHGLDAWTEAVQRMGSSEFCCGQNERGWKGDIDFLLQPKSFMRLIEGHYGGSAAVNSGGDVFCASDDPTTRFHVIRFRNEHDGHDPPDAIYGGKAGYMIPASWVKAMQLRQANGN